MQVLHRRSQEATQEAWAGYHEDPRWLRGGRDANLAASSSSSFCTAWGGQPEGNSLSQVTQTFLVLNESARAEQCQHIKGTADPTGRQ